MTTITKKKQTVNSVTKRESHSIFHGFWSKRNAFVQKHAFFFAAAWMMAGVGSVEYDRDTVKIAEENGK